MGVRVSSVGAPQCSQWDALGFRQPSRSASAVSTRASTSAGKGRIPCSAARRRSVRLIGGTVMQSSTDFQPVALQTHRAWRLK